MTDSDSNDIKKLLEKGFSDINTRLDYGQEMMGSLWRAVHNSDPPPTLEALAERQAIQGDTPRASLLAKSSSHDLSIESLKGDLALQTVKLDALSKRMGLDAESGKALEGLSFYKSHEGRKFVLTVLAAATGILTTLGATVSAITGHPFLVPQQAPVYIERPVYAAPPPPTRAPRASASGTPRALTPAASDLGAP